MSAEVFELKSHFFDLNQKLNKEYFEAFLSSNEFVFYHGNPNFLKYLDKKITKEKFVYLIPLKQKCEKLYGEKIYKGRTKIGFSRNIIKRIDTHTKIFKQYTGEEINNIILLKPTSQALKLESFLKMYFYSYSSKESREVIELSIFDIFLFFLGSNDFKFFLYHIYHDESFDINTIHIKEKEIAEEEKELNLLWRNFEKTINIQRISLERELCLKQQKINFYKKEIKELKQKMNLI